MKTQPPLNFPTGEELKQLSNSGSFWAKTADLRWFKGKLQQLLLNPKTGDTKWENVPEIDVEFEEGKD